MVPTFTHEPCCLAEKTFPMCLEHTYCVLYVSIEISAACVLVYP